MQETDQRMGQTMEYKVEYRNDKRILAAFYGLTVCRTYRKIGVVILAVGIVQTGITLGAWTGTLQLTFDRHLFFLLMAMGIGEIAIGVILFAFHAIMGNAAMKQGLKLHQGVMPITRISLGTQITVQEGTAVSTYDYRQITQVRQNRQLFCIMFGRYSGVALPRSGFVKGNPAVFGQWLRQRIQQDTSPQKVY